MNNFFNVYLNFSQHFLLMECKQLSVVYKWPLYDVHIVAKDFQLILNCNSNPLFAALFFYLPHFIWKQWEGCKLKHLVQNLRDPFLCEEEKSKQIKLVIKSLNANRDRQNIYAYKYFICELMNFVNVIIQIRLIDTFLGGEFSSFGINVLRFMTTEQWDRADPMVKVFPKVTKCDFYQYGSSGTIQKYDGECEKLCFKIFKIIFWVFFSFV